MNSFELLCVSCQTQFATSVDYVFFIHILILNVPDRISFGI